MSRSTVAVLGVGETEYSRRSGKSVPRLGVDAARAALADAEIDASQVDGVVTVGGFIYTDDLSVSLGLRRNLLEASPPPGGNGGVGSIGLGRAMIESGQASLVLVVLARNGSSEARIGARARLLPGQHLRAELEHPHGWTTPAQWYSMICRRHMYEFGTSKEDLAEVALTMRAHAQLNPRAMMYGRPLTRGQYDASPMIADPYQLLDCCLETDGGAAVVLGARHGHDRSVSVLAAVTARPESPDDLTNRRDWFDVGLSSAAPRAWTEAGLGPADVDVAMIYDCFTFEVLHQLEEAGFCPRGESGPFVAAGKIRLGGQLPVNPHGGLLSEGHLSGLNHIVEAVRQLRGQAGDRQVAGASVAAVTGWGDLGDGSIVVMGR